MSVRPDKPLVFLAYSHADMSAVRLLRDALVENGVDVWWDQDLTPGLDWRSEASRVQNIATAVVACFSALTESKGRRGIFPEVRDAIAIYRQLPPDSVYLIPVRLADCSVPELPIDSTRTLADLHHVDFFPPERRPAAVESIVTALLRHEPSWATASDEPAQRALVSSAPNPRPSEIAVASFRIVPDIARRIHGLQGGRKGVLVLSFLLLSGLGAGWLINIDHERWSGQQRPQSRIRIRNVVAIPKDESRAPFPAITIYYDNVGPLPASAIVVRYGAVFVPGQLTPESILSAQDKLLTLDGWQEEMRVRAMYYMHPGDPGEFTSVPRADDALAKDFRENFNNVATGSRVLYIFLAFKYKDSSMLSNTVGVTEDCFWFSGNFARHSCGRGRAFLETHK